MLYQPKVNARHSELKSHNLHRLGEINMKVDYTHISIILDRTGSMESIRDDTIGGFNNILRDTTTFIHVS